MTAHSQLKADDTYHSMSRPMTPLRLELYLPHSRYQVPIPVRDLAISAGVCTASDVVERAASLPPCTSASTMEEVAYNSLDLMSLPKSMEGHVVGSSKTGNLR